MSPETIGKISVLRISLKHIVVKRLFYWEKLTFLQKI